MSDCELRSRTNVASSSSSSLEDSTVSKQKEPAQPASKKAKETAGIAKAANAAAVTSTTDAGDKAVKGRRTDFPQPSRNAQVVAPEEAAQKAKKTAAATNKVSIPEREPVQGDRSERQSARTGDRPRQVSGAPSDASFASQRCKAFTRGLCPLGEFCKHAHSTPSPRIAEDSLTTKTTARALNNDVHAEVVPF